MKVPIIFTIDQAMEVPAGVCITSLLENALPDTFYDIIILHGPGSDFTSSPLQGIPVRYSNCTLSFRKVIGEFVGGYEIRGIPETAYYRLVSPEIVREYDKYLYSDVDVIFREDLSSYFNIDLEDNYFGAVETCSPLRPSYQKYLQKEYAYDYRDGYYYSGNLIINAKRLLEGNKIQEFRRLGKNKYHQQDMTIMNLACRGKILPLSPAYCVTTSILDLIIHQKDRMMMLYGQKEIERALTVGTIHYNGAKPWKELTLNMDLWWTYYRRSIFWSENDSFAFWDEQRMRLVKMPFLKRLKMLLRYPLDRKEW